MRFALRWRFLVTAFTLATLVYAIRTRQWSGRFLLVPYDFRPPTPRRFMERMWNPHDPRIFTPHVFGVGWSVNWYQVLSRLRGLGDRAGPKAEVRQADGGTTRRGA